MVCKRKLNHKETSCIDYASDSRSRTGMFVWITCKSWQCQDQCNMLWFFYKCGTVVNYISMQSRVNSNKWYSTYTVTQYRCRSSQQAGASLVSPDYFDAQQRWNNLIMLPTWHRLWQDPTAVQLDDDIHQQSITRTVHDVCLYKRQIPANNPPHHIMSDNRRPAVWRSWRLYVHGPSGRWAIYLCIEATRWRITYLRWQRRRHSLNTGPSTSTRHRCTWRHILSAKAVSPVTRYNIRLNDAALHVQCTHLTAAGCHLPYGITQCTCHPTQVNTPHLTPVRNAGTGFTYPGGMEGWVDLVGWSHTEMMYLPAVTHPSINRARRRVTCWLRPTHYS